MAADNVNTVVDMPSTQLNYLQAKAVKENKSRAIVQAVIKIVETLTKKSHCTVNHKKVLFTIDVETHYTWMLWWLVGAYTDKKCNTIRINNASIVNAGDLTSLIKILQAGNALSILDPTKYTKIGGAPQKYLNGAPLKYLNGYGDDILCVGVRYGYYAGCDITISIGYTERIDYATMTVRLVKPSSSSSSLNAGISICDFMKSEL